MASVGAFPRNLMASYLGQDPRNLGLFRVTLGLLTIGDLVRRYPHVATFYSNEGVLTNHFALFRPPYRHFFSVFLGFSTPEEVRVLLVLSIIAAALFTVGLGTRVFQVVTFVALTSLHARNPLLDGPGDMVLRLLAAWSIFLPLGARFSVDALVRSLDTAPEHTPADLRSRDALHPRGIVLRAAAFALLLELAVVFLLRRPQPAPALGGGAAWATVFVYAIQCLVVACALAPVLRVVLHRVAVVGIAVVSAALVALGDDPAFAAAILGFLPLLLTPADWDRMRAWSARGRHPLRVIYDQDCGVCLFVCRVLVRLDAASCLTFTGNDDAALPAGATREELDRTVLVVDETTGVIATKIGRGCAHSARSLVRASACLGSHARSLRAACRPRLRRVRGQPSPGLCLLRSCLLRCAATKRPLGNGSANGR